MKKTRLDKLILFFGAKNGAKINRKLWETYLYQWISHIYFSLNLLPTSLGLSWIVFTSFGSSKFLILLLLLLSVGLSIFPSLFFPQKACFIGRYDAACKHLYPFQVKSVNESDFRVLFIFCKVCSKKNFFFQWQIGNWIKQKQTITYLVIVTHTWSQLPVFNLGMIRHYPMQYGIGKVYFHWGDLKC